MCIHRIMRLIFRIVIHIYRIMRHILHIGQWKLSKLMNLALG